MPARRGVRTATAWRAVLAFLLPAFAVSAAGIDALSSQDAASGLRAALSQGIDAAVGRLGKTDDFSAAQ
jgi:hypothetical protein